MTGKMCAEVHENEPSRSPHGRVEEWKSEFMEKHNWANYVLNNNIYDNNYYKSN